MTAGKEIDRRDQVQLPGIISVKCFILFFCSFPLFFIFALITEQRNDGLVF
jgi:hypothetical protein